MIEHKRMFPGFENSLEGGPTLPKVGPYGDPPPLGRRRQPSLDLFEEIVGQADQPKTSLSKD